MGNTTSLFAKNPFARTKPPPRSQSKPRMSPNTSLGFSHSLLIRWLATLSYDDVQLFVLALVANDFDYGNFTLPADYDGDEERLMMTMSDKDVQCILEHCTAGVLQGCASEEYIMAVLFIVVDQAEREGLMATIRFLDDLLRLAFYIKEGATGPIDSHTRHLHLDIIEAMENLYQIGIEDVPAWEGYERSEEMDRMLDSLCQHFRYYKSVRNLAVHWASTIIPGGPEAEDGSKSMVIRD